MKLHDSYTAVLAVLCNTGKRMNHKNNIYIDIKLKSCSSAVCPSVRHKNSSPGAVGIDTLSIQHETLIICLLQVCYYELMWHSAFALQWVEGKDLVECVTSKHKSV